MLSLLYSISKPIAFSPLAFTVSTVSADGARYVITAHQRNTAGEDHDSAAAGRVEAVEGLAGLRHICKVLRRQQERGRGKGLVYSNLDTAQPGIFHPSERLELPSVIDNRDIHRLAYLLRFLLGRLDYRLGLLERNRFSCHGVASFLVVLVVRYTYGLWPVSAALSLRLMSLALYLKVCAVPVRTR